LRAERDRPSLELAIGGVGYGSATTFSTAFSRVMHSLKLNGRILARAVVDVSNLRRGGCDQR